jgi:hypothetical protein
MGRSSAIQEHSPKNAALLSLTKAMAIADHASVQSRLPPVALNANGVALIDLAMRRSPARFSLVSCGLSAPGLRSSLLPARRRALQIDIRVHIFESGLLHQRLGDRT